LNSATLTGKNGSISEDNVTVGIHNGTSGWSEAYWQCNISASGNPLNGKTCTISLDFKTTDITKIGAMFFGFGTWNSSTRVGDLNIAVSTYKVLNGTMANNTWCRISNTFTVPTTWTTEALTYRLQIKTNSGAEGAIMYHKRIKVEMNSFPTPWTICPNDIGFTSNYGITEYQDCYNPSITKILENNIKVTEIIEY
jgi:hypothetical protein